ncbi:hypothetical protein GF362_07350 [Candidatus Dojkabacteria bacterium]|nr:hypothetical protein [Candidatus Dojkabacteria bacterium]
MKKQLKTIICTVFILLVLGFTSSSFAKVKDLESVSHGWSKDEYISFSFRGVDQETKQEIEIPSKLDVYIKGVKFEAELQDFDIPEEMAEMRDIIGMNYKIFLDCDLPAFEPEKMPPLYIAPDAYGYYPEDVVFVAHYSDGDMVVKSYKQMHEDASKDFWGVTFKDDPNWCTVDYSTKATLFDIVGHTFESYINNLYADGIVSGYSDNTFRPDFPVSRGAMAKFVRKGLGFEINTSCGDFPDVSSSYAFYNDIQTLKCEGVISGYGDGEFKPERLVTRGQAMKFLIEGARAKTGNPEFLAVEGIEGFPDVPQTYTFYENIMAAYGNDIVSGYSTGYFKPDDPVTRGAMSKMVDNTRKKL